MSEYAGGASSEDWVDLFDVLAGSLLVLLGRIVEIHKVKYCWHINVLYYCILLHIQINIWWASATASLLVSHGTFHIY